jgi:hypothetical protein
MKSLIVLAVIGAMVVSCNSRNTDITTKTNTSANAAYAPSEGDATYRNGKLMVWQDGEWEEADNDVHLSNGIVVKRNGEVIRRDQVIILEEGEVVDRSGRFFDKAGNAIEDAWEATKKGAKKTKEEVKDVFKDHDKDRKYKNEN